MMTIYLICYLDHRSALMVREKFYFEDEALAYIKDNHGHFLMTGSEP